MARDKSPLISRIQALTKARFIGWLFAADGQWDVAERTLLEHTAQQTLSRIEHWLALQMTENISFEALLESERDERCCFGVRITHLTTQEKAGVISRLIAMSSKGDGIDTTIQNIRSVLGGLDPARYTPDS